MTRFSTFSVDGVPLDGPDWRMLKGTVLPAAAARRVSRLELFPRDGVVSVRGGFGVGVAKFSLFVPDEGVGGAVGSGEVRLGVLVALLARATRLGRVFPEGVSRRVGVVDVRVSDPARLGRGWRVAADFTLDPFWGEGSGVVMDPVDVMVSGGDVYVGV